jgi:hypothetical protein
MRVWNEVWLHCNSIDKLCKIECRSANRDFEKRIDENGENEIVLALYTPEDVFCLSSVCF